MSRAQAIIATLIAYKIALVAIGLWASRRTHDNEDFFLGGRRLGPFVAAISASASSSSAWTLLGVSGAAFAWGWPALWLFPATVGGFLINWLYVAPRLMQLSRDSGAITLTDVLAGGGGAASRWIARLAALIVVFSFVFYIAAQFQAAGNAFAANFDLSRQTSVLVGTAIVLVYTLLGGFWAVSVTDALQGLMMAATAVLLPVAALVAVGGPAGLAAGIAGTAATPVPTTGLAAIAFVMGLLGIGLGYPGQPHVLNRFMALRDARALAGARVIAIAWAVVVYAGMLVLGLCARVLVSGREPREEIFYLLTAELFPPVVAGVMLAAVLSAVMSTADSQLLVTASAVTHDLRRERDRRRGLLVSRLTVVAISIMAATIALLAPQTIFARVLFAWHAVGSAFGPLLIAIVAGWTVAPWARIAAMLTGFALTVVLHSLPDAPGDYVERLLPLALSSLLVAAGSSRTRASDL